MNHYFFCHGFGFDKSYWINFVPIFKKERCTYLDLGYFGESNLYIKNNTSKLIGIAHSLGLIKLLSTKKHFDHLIGLNSFIDFLGFNEDLQRERIRELNFLKRNFISSPVNTLKRFYERCGLLNANNLESQKIDVDVATKDLNLLYESFTLPQNTQTLIIGTEDDVIVPPVLLYDNFEKNLNVKIEIISSGKHTLGLNNAYFIYEKIIDFTK